ncbi:hypothetical protein [Mucilaginibacter gynuensis]|uniref:hypothetical protein n=1 Tax=Mucilaginibacter gynuensis TaxID=1302236 RepID=UPI0031EA7B46
MAEEELFLTTIKGRVDKNDLIRLDWQLTQSGDEAALICNDFEDEAVSSVVNGMMLVNNVVKKNQSIIDLAQFGNQYLPSKFNAWVDNGTINKDNKPDILWITDYRIELNSTTLYN